MARSIFITLFLLVAHADARSATNQGLIDGAAKYCADVPEDLGLNKTVDPLIAQIVGGTNYLDLVVLDTECDTITDCITKYRTDLILEGLRVSVPLIFAILSLIVWLILSCCACCRCCRRCCIWCCCKEKAFPSYFSRGVLAFIWSSFAILLILVIVDTAFAAVSTESLQKGSESILCRSMTLASDILNGGSLTDVPSSPTNATLTNISFIGTDPLYQELENLAKILDANSTMMQGIETTVNDTVDLDNAMSKLSAYLQLTEDMLGAATTMKASPTGEYTCVLCEACCSGGDDSYVHQMRAAVADSFAESVKSVRYQIQETLTGSGLVESREAVNNAADTMLEITTTIEDNFGSAVVDNSSKIDTGLLILSIVTIVLTCSALVPVFWFILSLIYGVCRSKKSSYADPQDKPRNPCVASTGWCLSLLYAFLIFLVGGLLYLSGWASASFCDVFRDLDTAVDKLIDRFAESESGDGLGSKVAGSCFKSTGDGDFLSRIESGNLTARQVFNNVTDIAPMIEEAFNESPDIPNVAEIEVFKQLTDSMLEYKSVYMIPAERIAALRADSTFSANAMDTDQTEAGYGGSGYCNAQTFNLTKTPVGAVIEASLIASGMTIADKQTAVVPGATEYETSISTVTGFTYTGTCASLSVNKDDYNPFSSLLFWKGEVMEKSDFKCNTIQETTDVTTGKIIYTQVTATCADQAAFDTYILNLRTQLIDAATAVDIQAELTKNRIETDIVTDITDSVIPPIQTVLDNSDCRVLRFRWNAFYNSFCTNFTVGIVGLGITFAIYGGLTLIAVISMVIIWRNLKDNITLWRDLVKERGDRRGAIRNVVAASPSPAPVQIVPNTGK
jgi:hypothetical protein